MNDKDTERVPFCCDYHDRYGDHCLFQYQTARPPKASDAARQILNKIIAAGATVPSWNTGQRQQSETKILAAIDGALTTIRKEEREAAFLEAADYIRRQWLAAYPVEVFPEPPKPPAECSRDRISAAMGRHMAMKLIEHFEAAASTKGENDVR